ncbi:TonB-linked outer membrane protein, SusC/RagA family [Pedobacter steynii]|uniref:TonB-linked outer membrane protein, SusC/RagA family n=1 Tax=Pedobacter steynii TaxID=430522 RepID=A0A1G9Y843_9SPHI|nr:SusC/RagA family TonB-linked outer membrane protein [Pedobacter steynii]NQX39635.1 SusC/RagA family TonB-linked outer membrane protein [Pedobacter steynii]SDN05254.1 TonB-linked outer membrane protein, SusC/RagA family [Pedobacter steynii]
MPRGYIIKFLATMKLIAVFLIAGMLQVSAAGFAQRFNYIKKNTSLKQLFNEINKQTGYDIIWSKRNIKNTRNINADFQGTPLEEVLKIALKDQPLSYTIKGKMIIIRKQTPVTDNFASLIKVIDIKGRVLDENGKPLSGASIKVKSSTKGTTSDGNGEFSLQGIAENAELIVSFLGYTTKEVKATSDPMTISLSPQQNELENVVISVGYGTQKKINITSAISTVSGKEMDKIPSSSLSNVLAGRLAGMHVRTATGAPGAGSGVRIRASASWNASDPLFVIDGVIRDKTSFDALDPNEVDQISALKDAASAAVYGSRAANGVILVTTKKGAPGKAQVEYNSIFTMDKASSYPEYIDMKTALKTTQAAIGGVSDEEIDWVLKANPGGMANFNAVYQDPASQKHSLSISGGSEKLTYYLGGSFFNDKAFLPNTKYNRYNLRSNISSNITRDLTLSLNLATTYGTKNRFNFLTDNSDDLGGLWPKLLYFDVFSIPYMDGKPVNPGWLGNLPEMIKNSGYLRNNNQQIDALMKVDYRVPFVQGLSLHASFSKNINNSFDKIYGEKQTIYNFKRTGPNSLIVTNEILSSTKSGNPEVEYLTNQYTKSDSYQLNTQINYDRTFGKHHLAATGIYEQYEYQSYNFSMTRNNFPLFPVDQFFAASKNNSDWRTGGEEKQDGRLSYIGRVIYEYAGKYFFSGSIRRDGSIKFAPDQRWGWFPSVSGGWLASEENWYKSSKLYNTINMIKLRASYGITGDDGIGGWKWLDQYNIQKGTYYMGNPATALPRISYGGLPAAHLTWEKSESTNIGLDLKIKDRFTFTTELWKKHTYDILGERVLVLPSEFGAKLPASNYGIGDAKGIEFELGYNSNPERAFTYNLKGTFGLATTKTILKDHASNAQPFDNPEGKTASYSTGYRATGILRAPSDIDKLPANYTIMGAKPELGMMNFEDISGPAGQPDGKIDGYDKIVLGKYMGSNNAPISFGLLMNFAYKGFTLDMLFAGSAGFDLTYNDSWGRNFGGGGKIPVYHADSWTAENPGGSTPKLYAWGDSRANGYTEASTFNTYNASFVRMKYLNLGYNIPKSVLKITGINNVKLYTSTTNLFYLSKFKFYDPELNGFGSYPIMRSFILGLNIQF